MLALVFLLVFPFGVCAVHAFRMHIQTYPVDKNCVYEPHQMIAQDEINY